MFKFTLATAAALSSIALVNARTFTVTNNCPYTVWPGMFTDLNVGSAVPDQPNGWEAPSGHSVSFNVPEDWKAGRIWGRTGCDFSETNGAIACETGSCNGGLICDARTGTGVPPASVAEWTLSDDNSGSDWYDVSLVDGSNIPMAITNTAGCPEASCPVDLDANCPAELVGPNGAGCSSACFANLDGNQQDSGNCCSGSHNTADTCPPSGVQFYDYFKSNCPNSYAYAYDESSGTALFTCPLASAPDYTLTFCP